MKLNCDNEECDAIEFGPHPAPAFSWARVVVYLAVLAACAWALVK